MIIQVRYLMKGLDKINGEGSCASLHEMWCGFGVENDPKSNSVILGANESRMLIRFCLSSEFEYSWVFGWCGQKEVIIDDK